MKLFYRGVSYESNSQMIETVETGTTARFRGLNYQVRRPLIGAYSQPQRDLRYRGIAYTINPNAAINSQMMPKVNSNNSAMATAHCG